MQFVCSLFLAYVLCMKISYVLYVLYVDCKCYVVICKSYVVHMFPYVNSKYFICNVCNQYVTETYGHWDWPVSTLLSCSLFLERVWICCVLHLIRLDMRGLFVKKVHVLNKNIVHLIDDIFWNCGFKTETQGEQVNYCNYWYYCTYFYYCNCLHLLLLLCLLLLFYSLMLLLLLCLFFCVHSFALISIFLITFGSINLL